MIERTARIQNQDGIHCRPSTVIIKSLQDYRGKVTIRGERGETPLNSVVGLMTLALLPGNEVTICVDGPDEDQTAAKLVELFETHFDFPARADGTKPFLDGARSAPT